MADRDVTLELVTIEHLDFEPPCEGVSHPYGQWGHVPRQSAAYLVILPCGTERMMCEGWVSDAAFYDYTECTAGCHGTAHSGEGHELGWSVNSWADPKLVPVLYRGVMSWLTDDGRVVDVGPEPNF